MAPRIAKIKRRKGNDNQSHSHLLLIRIIDMTQLNIKEILSTLAVCIALTIGYGSYITSPGSANADHGGDCHVKNCTVEGEDCKCCLKVDGSVGCPNCGATDCSEDDQEEE